MNIIQVDVHNGRQRRQFEQLPFKIYRDIPQWVPPLGTELRHMLDERHHSFYQQGVAAFFLAIHSTGDVAGRLAVLNNQAYNQFNHEKTAFFYLFECTQDVEIARALFAQGGAWARAQGLNKMVGPKGFTILDGMGLLVKGFEHRPAFGLPYNPDYYPALLEQAGFSPANEMVSGYLHAASMQLPEKVQRVAERVQTCLGMRVMRFKNRRDFRKMIPALQQLYNQALEGTTGNIPLTTQDIKTMTDQLLWFADPRLIKIILKDDQPIGFLLAYADISVALQRCRGRLLPLGWLDLLLETRRTKWVNINGAAILPQFRGMGATALLFSEMYASIRKGGFEHADLVQIGTDNERMQLELRSLGINFYKVHRMYEKNL